MNTSVQSKAKTAALLFIIISLALSSFADASVVLRQPRGLNIGPASIGGSGNNGGATAGNGGSGGAASIGGSVRSGNVTTNAGSVNVMNRSVVIIGR